MPRTARTKSASGIYHVILRGANKQVIFHDDRDCIQFLKTLKKFKVKAGMKVFAWCLMGNHVHLLVREEDEDLSSVMKRIGVSYVRYYNLKYEAVGHLFQGRFISENVESLKSLLAVTRYIHQNPVKAGLVRMPGEWEWSSCRAYYGKVGYKSELLDSSFVMSKFGNELHIAREKFREFNEAPNDDQYMENVDRKMMLDREARVEIKAVLGSIEIPHVKRLPREERNELLKQMKAIRGLSQRQIARILGIPPNVVFRA